MRQLNVALLGVLLISSFAGVAAALEIPGTNPESDAITVSLGDSQLSFRKADFEPASTQTRSEGAEWLKRTWQKTFTMIQNGKKVVCVAVMEEWCHLDCTVFGDGSENCKTLCNTLVRDPMCE